MNKEKETEDKDYMRFVNAFEMHKHTFSPENIALLFPSLSDVCYDWRKLWDLYKQATNFIAEPIRDWEECLKALQKIEKSQEGFKSKTWFLFAGDSYYPLGGLDNFITSQDTIEDCVEYLKLLGCRNDVGCRFDWIQVFNKDTLETVGIDM
jgi:hypothetical protein